MSELFFLPLRPQIKFRYENKTSLFRILCVASLSLLFSCSDKRDLENYETIRMIGDENPDKALVMLDSLEIEIREMSEYAKCKYDLLRIRLNDKAYNMPTSDLMIRKLMNYFEDEGSLNEKQEVFYYAGTHNDKSCDSIMMRNAYSNLNDLYYNVQNYDAAAKAAQDELEISKRMNKDIILPYLHLGTAQLARGDKRQARTAFDAAFDEIKRSNNPSGHQYELLYLLCDYSLLKQASNARDCFSMLETDPLSEFSDFPCMAFAKYYELCGKTDSAIVYCNLLLDKGTDIYNKYDASKLLFRIYNRLGDAGNAYRSATVYMGLSDSLDFGRRQELAATVNNEFQYHLDQKKEQKLKDEKKKYKNSLVFVALAAIMLASAAYILYIRRRNRHLQEVLSLSAELQQMSDDEKLLRKDIEQREKDLEKSRRSLERTTDELSNVKGELQRVSAELSGYEETLKEKERQLSEKMEQNRTFIKLLHQSELEGKAEDVIYAIRQSSAGRKDMSETDWKQLYQAVDQLYPTFHGRVSAELGREMTEQKMKVCYLMHRPVQAPDTGHDQPLARHRLEVGEEV